jgi:hypothetical protein
MASEPLPDLISALEVARQDARDQLAAAWNLHVSRVETALHSDWLDHLDHLLADRFEQLRPSMEAEFQKRLAPAVRKATTAQLNQAVRRILQAENQQDWSSALIDAARASATRAAVFTVQESSVRLEQSYPATQPISIELADAAAIDQAVRTREPLVCVWSQRELSPSLVATLGAPTDGSRVYLFPIQAGDRTVALLYADGLKDEVDSNAIELAATVSASVWERRQPEPPPQLVTIESAPAPAEAVAWAGLSPDQQELQLRAQRFARVKVAEIQLYRAAGVRKGRIEADLYRVLKHEIDDARDAYRQQFLSDGGPQVDYIHSELLHKLANDKEELLGPGYPGPLV